MVTNYNLDIDLYRISSVTSATSNNWQSIRFSCCLYSDSLWRWKAGWLLVNFHKKYASYEVGYTVRIEPRDAVIFQMV